MFPFDASGKPSLSESVSLLFIKPSLSVSISEFSRIAVPGLLKESESL